MELGHGDRLPANVAMRRYMSLSRPQPLRGSIRRVAVIAVLALASAALWFAWSVLPIAASSGGSGIYGFVNTSPTVTVGSSVAITVNGTSLVPSLNVADPVLCYSVSSGGPSPAASSEFTAPSSGSQLTFITNNGTLTSNTSTFNIQTTGSAVAGHTVLVTLLTSSCTNPVTHVNDTVTSFSTASTITLTFTGTGAPTVTSISPHSGIQGNTVTVNGTNFISGSTVAFGVAVTGLTPTIANTSQLTVAVPAGLTSGTTYDIIVTNTGGSSSSNSNDLFKYTTGPVVTSLSSTSGPAGTFLTINGFNLTGVTCANVKFGGFSAASCGTTSATQIANVVAPSGPSGTISVIVSNGTTSSPDTVDDNFTYTALSTLPTVTSVSPAICPLGGGQTITLGGSGFVSGQTTVTFGGLAFGYNVSVGFFGTTLTVTCPSLPVGVYHIQVTTTTGGQSVPTVNDLITYSSFGSGLPAVTGVNPPSGPVIGGNLVTVSGVNFVNVTGVTFGGLPATSFTVIGSGMLYATAPAAFAGTTVDVRVTTTLGTSLVNQPADLYSYSNGLVITSVSPTSDVNQCGTSFTATITGANFVFGASSMIVTFGGVQSPSVTVPNSNTILAVVPPHPAGIVDVTVSTLGGLQSFTLPQSFTYTCSAVPIITSVSPNSGGPGTAVTLTGAGFSTVQCPGGVTFGGVSAASCFVNSDGSLTAVVPQGAPAGQLTIFVTNSAGTSSSLGAALFTNTSVKTTSYQLYSIYTLIGWLGQDGIAASAALAGPSPAVGNPATTNVSGVVTVIWRFDATTQSFKAYFPGHETDGLSDFTTLQKGVGYYIGMAPGTPSTTWTVVQG